jgi:flagellin
MYVQTNISSLFAQNKLANTQLSMNRTFERLSSGFRINSAADDSAGLGISESMNAQVRAYAVAERNANDGISMAQVADGAAGQIGGILVRLRELAVQSANGLMSAGDRSNLQTEFTSLFSEINRITSVTRFNGLELLTGNGGTVYYQVSINNTESEQIAVSAFALPMNVSGLGINAEYLLSAANVTYFAPPGTVLSSLSLAQSAPELLGLGYTELSSSPLFVYQNSTATDSLSLPSAIPGLASATISGGAMLTEIASAATYSPINVLERATALTAISRLDSALQAVNQIRETYGAAMNRLQTAVQGIQSARTNLSASLSRIRDVDVAEEAANMTKWQVLSQAGVSVLAQANQAPQVALSLLK